MIAPTTEGEYVVPIFLRDGILKAQRQMNKNMNECLFGDLAVHVPSLRQKICAFFKKANNRLSNAYDCLVKGVDPYDGY